MRTPFRFAAWSFASEGVEPPCDPCGLVVDAVRSCFKGKWRFYSETPEAITSGHLYFADPGTPTLSFPHYFGSAAWRRGDEGEGNETLGQVKFLGQRWSPGFKPWTPQTLTPTCPPERFTAALSYPADAPTEPYIGEVCRACIPAPAPPAPAGQPTLTPSAVYACWFQKFCSQMLDWLLYNRPSQLQWVADNFLRSNRFQYWLGLVPDVPNHAIFIQERSVLIMISGTVNNRDLWNQAWRGMLPPATMCDGITTMPGWFNRMQRMLVNFATIPGFPWADKTVIVTGHSQGAAIAWIMSLYMRLFHRLNWHGLYMAIPVPGDFATSDDRFGGREYELLVNYDDPVPHIPPQANADLWDIYPPLRVYVNSVNWWAPGRHQYLYMRENGERFRDQLRQISPNLFRTLFGIDPHARSLTNWPMHQQSEYTRRILLHCPRREAIFSPEVYDFLFSPETSSKTFYGGLRVCGGLEFPANYGTPSGIVLHGDGIFTPRSADPAPGDSCGDAGVLPLNYSLNVSVPIGQEAWTQTAIDAVSTYRITLSGTNVNFGSLNADTGDCAALVPHGTLVADGVLEIGPIGSAATLFVHVLTTLIGSGSATATYRIERL